MAIIKSVLTLFLLLYGSIEVTAQFVPEDLGDRLTYSDGIFGHLIRKNGKRLNTSEIRTLYKSNQKALNLYDGGKALKVLGIVLAIPSGFILGYFFASPADDENRTVGLVTGAIGVVGSLSLGIIGSSNIRKSVTVYNIDLYKAHRTSLRPFFNGLQVGICLSF